MSWRPFRGKWMPYQRPNVRRLYSVAALYASLQVSPVWTTTCPSCVASSFHMSLCKPRNSRRKMMAYAHKICCRGIDTTKIRLSQLRFSFYILVQFP